MEFILFEDRPPAQRMSNEISLMYDLTYPAVTGLIGYACEF